MVSWQVAGALLATPFVKGLKNDVGLEHVHDPHLLVVRHLTKAARVRECVSFADADVIFDLDSQKLEHMVPFFASGGITSFEPLEFVDNFSFNLVGRQVDLIACLVDIPDLFPE